LHHHVQDEDERKKAWIASETESSLPSVFRFDAGYV
jgi:hypothetical protein